LRTFLRIAADKNRGSSDDGSEIDAEAQIQGTARHVPENTIAFVVPMHLTITYLSGEVFGKNPVCIEWKLVGTI